MRRRERLGDFDASYRLMATAAFQDRIAAGYYEMLRLENALYGKALALLEKIISPLRSLDATHLAIVRLAGIAELVTADKVMAEAAKELA